MSAHIQHTHVMIKARAAATVSKVQHAKYLLDHEQVTQV